MSLVVNATGYVSSPMWTSRSEIERMFGEDNVRQWADLENTQDATKIATNVQDAVANATYMSKAQLEGSLAGAIVVAPKVLRYHVTMRAGVILYEKRGIQDTSDEEGKHRLSPIRARADKWFVRVLAGQIRLGTALTMHPIVVPNSDPDDVVNAEVVEDDCDLFTV